MRRALIYFTLLTQISFVWSMGSKESKPVSSQVISRDFNNKKSDKKKNTFKNVHEKIVEKKNNSWWWIF